MPTPPIDWLKSAADGRLEMSGVNVWKALRHRAYVQIIDKDSNVLHEVSRLKDCISFRVTQRGYDLLEHSDEIELPFNKNDPPMNIRLWTSAFRRWIRNCPDGLSLTFSEGQLHILAADTDGKTKNDDVHRVASMKVRWHGN